LVIRPPAWIVVARSIQVENLGRPDVALRLVPRDLADLADDVGHPLTLLEDDPRRALHRRGVVHPAPDQLCVAEDAGERLI